MAFWSRRKSLRAPKPKESVGKSIKLFTADTDVLGIGTYGAVYKAQCNDFPCAAKILHPTLFEPSRKVSFKKFEQECEFMFTLRHPNILQYYGTHQDSKSGLPVLVMELMDSNLTKFLEGASKGLPLHTEINLCHDVAVALSFLHSVDILHHSLSSNNVLLIGNSRAKISDFGMSRLSGVHQSRSSLSSKEVYMPPEALRGKPLHAADKIDVFSLGVLIIQVLTRKFPKPGVGTKAVQIEHPHFTNIDVGILEIERRQNHISEVDPNHSLLPIALSCLKDRPTERPTAQEICHKIAALRETDKYTESTQKKSTAKEDKMKETDTSTETRKDIKEEVHVRELEMELESQSQQHSQELEECEHHYFQSISTLQEEHSQEIDTFQKRYTEDIETIQQQRFQQVKSLQQLLKTQYHSLQEKNILAAAQQEEIQKLRQELAARNWKKEETIGAWKLENQQLKQELEVARCQLKGMEKLGRKRQAHLGKLTEQLQLGEQEVAELKSQLYDLEQLLLSETVDDTTFDHEHNGPKNGEEVI